MRRCIIHIGTHKTGSTSLQRFLAVNRSRLESAGFLYPVEAAEAAHHDLFRELSGKPAKQAGPLPAERIVRRMRESSADVAVLSSELFSTFGTDDDGPARLAEIVQSAGFAPEVVMFVRPQHVLFNSMYTQRVKMLAEPARFADYVVREMRTMSFDFEKLAAPWETPSFKALTAIPFTASRLTEGIETAFFSALGLSEHVERLTGVTPLEPANIGNGPRAVELCRRLSEVGGQSYFGDAYQTVRRKAQREAARLNWNETPFMALTGDLHNSIRDAYAASNERFARLVWDASWMEVFASDHARQFTPNELGTADLDRDKLAEVNAVYDRLIGRYGPDGNGPKGGVYRFLPDWMDDLLESLPSFRGGSWR